MAWSSGKDSAMALHELRTSGEYEVASLFTTVDEHQDRVSMHGVRRELLERQAEAVGLPIKVILMGDDPTNEEYEAKLQVAMAEFREAGIVTVAFGDIFLEDLRRHREEEMAAAGMAVVFPLWGRDTAALSRAACESGVRAVITCVDTEVLPAEYAGRRLDTALLDELPEGVDRCGENGEYHSFAFDGPGWKRGIEFRLGDRTLAHERYCVCDLLPGQTADEETA